MLGTQKGRLAGSGQPPEIHQQQKMGNHATFERRADQRYPLTAEVAYRITGEPGRPKTGNGKTIDISRHSVLISIGESVPKGVQMELSIAWPARLDGTIALSFEVFGTTTHVRGECVAVRIHRYGFRTRRSRPMPGPFLADKNVAGRDDIPSYAVH
jgi:hypothetical protein